MKTLVFLLAASLLTVPAASAQPEAACDPNNVEVECVFWEVVGLVTPERCEGANNVFTCIILDALEQLPP